MWFMLLKDERPWYQGSNLVSATPLLRALCRS
jgi:hypothetical protein